MNLEERRRFVRVPCTNILEYSVLGDRKQYARENYGYAHCKNVSLGGVLFSTFIEIPPGITLKIMLQMDCYDKHMESVLMHGEVVRCQKNGNFNTYDIPGRIFRIEDEIKSLNFFNWLAEKDEEYFLL